MPVRGECNCGKKATSEWAVFSKPKGKSKFQTCSTLIFCEKCKPKRETENFFCLYGKK